MACNNNKTWYTTVEKAWYMRKENWHAIEEWQPTVAEIRCKTFTMNHKCCLAR